MAHFEEALALWRGIPELPDGRRGTSEKTRWIEGHAALVEDRADALLATGRAAEIIGELEAAVADAPLRERRWGQLMLALYRAGRQGEALGAYQRARALLADELGVDPGPELRRLEAAVVAQDTALEMPTVQQVPSMTRAVTFLLTDIEGSTAAWEADADAMAVALARHDELVEQVVTSRGGRLIKTRGEGDATFSVSTAVGGRRRRPRIAGSDPVSGRCGSPCVCGWRCIPGRSSCATATTSVGRSTAPPACGRWLSVARSCARARPPSSSSIHCPTTFCSPTWEYASCKTSHARARLRAPPGNRRRPAAGRPNRSAHRAPEPAPGAGRPGPFVGRGNELARLVSAWQTALAGATNAMLIAGEPGVGKTRLAGEWSRQAYEQGALVIYGRCDEDLGAPYQPFAEALRSLVPCLAASAMRGLRGVEALLPLVPGLTEVLPDLAAPTRADPDTERTRSSTPSSRCRESPPPARRSS